MLPLMKDLLFTIDEHSSHPKYLQLEESITLAIEQGKLRTKDRLPSLNQVCRDYNLSRETVLKAYYLLMEKGIVASHHGKGFYVASTELKKAYNIFLLFTEMNEHKEALYNAFRKQMQEAANVDIFFHHHNPDVFQQLITRGLGKYNYYVIIPTFQNTETELIGILNEIPPEKLLILNRQLPVLNCAGVYQNFYHDTLERLKEALPLLQKYEQLNLIFPESVIYPQETMLAFEKFCQQESVPYLIIRHRRWEVQRRQAYLVLTNTDLAQVIRQAGQKGWKIGQEVGILSYNETPLKEVIGPGITVISTDFAQMGRTAAQLILEKRVVQVHNPSYLIQRASL